MARRPDSYPAIGTETIVGSGVTLQGDLQSDGDIVIEGRVKGKVHTDGDLTIGINAEVFGPVSATNIKVAGRLEGPLAAEGELTIANSGQVLGYITCRILSIQSGGLLLGRSQMVLPEKRHLEHGSPLLDNERPEG